MLTAGANFYPTGRGGYWRGVVRKDGKIVKILAVELHSGEKAIEDAEQWIREHGGSYDFEADNSGYV